MFILWVQVGVFAYIAGTGGTVTHAMRERAVMLRNPLGAGRSGIKKAVPRRAKKAAPGLAPEGVSCFPKTGKVHQLLSGPLI